MVKYGRENGGNTLAKYKCLALERHNDVEFKDAGFLLSQTYVLLVTTHAVLVKRSCCGESIVELSDCGVLEENDLVTLHTR